MKIHNFLLGVLFSTITTSCVSHSSLVTNKEIEQPTGKTMQLEQPDKRRLKVVFADNGSSFPQRGSFEFKSLKCGGDFQVEEFKSDDSAIILNQDMKFGSCVPGCQILIDRDMDSYHESCKGKITGSGRFKKNNNTEQLKLLAKRAVMQESAGNFKESISASGSGQNKSDKSKAESTSVPATTKVAGLAPIAGKSFTNSIGMEFVRVPAGTFMMGVFVPKKPIPRPCPPDDPFTSVDENKNCQYVNENALKRYEESTKNIDNKAHEVTISQDFYIGKHEVTQAQWYVVMGKNPSWNKSDRVKEDSHNHPVDKVSFNDVQEFIKKLNAKEGRNYRLPTEADWEYACRSGGKEEKFCGGNNPDAIAWHNGNSDKHSHRVGTKQANGLGIHDMSGNVREWCSDEHGPYDQGPVTDPQGRSDGYKFHIVRGGSYYETDGIIVTSLPAATKRASDVDFYDSGGLGFRLVAPQSGR